MAVLILPYVVPKAAPCHLFCYTHTACSTCLHEPISLARAVSIGSMAVYTTLLPPMLYRSYTYLCRTRQVQHRRQLQYRTEVGAPRSRMSSSCKEKEGESQSKVNGHVCEVKTSVMARFYASHNPPSPEGKSFTYSTSSDNRCSSMRRDSFHDQQRR